MTLLAPVHRRADLAYWIGRPYWGRGYATEAGVRLVAYAFGERGLNRVAAQAMRRNLLERLALRQDEVLAFLDELAIPFDNNQAERDLRGLKVHQKVAGCFRSDAGADAFACLRGYLATMRKQGQARLATLETVFTGQPLYPDML